MSLIPVWLPKSPTSIDGGVKDDGGKPAWDLFPFDALNEVAKVLEYGKRKYAAHNWSKGMDWGRMFGACLRHLAAWGRGENIDPESGLLHLAHAACCALMLLALTMRKVGKDDRAVLGPTTNPSPYPEDDRMTCPTCIEARKTAPTDPAYLVHWGKWSAPGYPCGAALESLGTSELGDVTCPKCRDWLRTEGLV